MALIDKLRAIADGFRSSRGTTQEYSLDEMATLAAEPVGGVGGGGGDSEWEEQFARAIENNANKPVTKLPDGITKIGDRAFYSKNLKLTSLPVGVTSIGTYAFYNCTHLALTSFPAGITSIGTYAFYNCSSLTSVTFEGTPSSIVSNAFFNCLYLRTINVPWAEGEVDNAPWGATDATINYNYTGG